MPDANGHYTWQEYHRKTGKGPQEFVKYQRYVANMPRKRAAKRAKMAADPLSQFLPTPTATGQKQAVSMADFAYQPAIAAENAQYAKQQQQLRDAITYYTKGLAQALPRGDVAYGWAQRQAGDQAAAAAALGTAATGQAAQGQQALSDYLNHIRAPEASQQFVTDVGGRGNWTAGNLAAVAAAGQQNVLNKGGGLAQYVSGLPRIAEIGGRRSLVNGLTGLAGKHSEALADLRAKRGASISENLQTFLNRELSKASAAAAYGKSIYATDAGVKKAKLSADAKAKSDATKGARIITPKDGSVWQVQPGKSPVQVAPPKTLPPTKDKTKTGGKGDRSRQVDEGKAATGASGLAQQMAGATKTVKVPTVIAGVDTGLKEDRKVPKYNEQQIANAVFARIWPTLMAYYTRAQVEAQALKYARAALGTGAAPKPMKQAYPGRT